MAKTVVPIELSSTPGIVDNSNATAITIDSSEDVTLAGHIVLTDSKEVKLGASTDMRIAHDGTDSFLTNNTGDFYLNQLADDKDILLRSDDGSGGIATYLTIDGSATKVILNKDTKLGDNIELQLGNDNDFVLKHNATNSVISTDTGDLVLLNNADDKDIVLQSDDGSGGTQTYLTIDGSADRTVFSRSSRHDDNVVATFGTSEDLQIYHDGSYSYIKENGTGDLRIQASTNVQIYNSALDKQSANFHTAGPVTLYYDNSAKFATSSSGVTITGDIANSSGDFTLDVAGDIVLDAGGQNIYFDDDGTRFMSISQVSSDVYLGAEVSDKDMFFRVNDGGTTVTALTLDGSDAGTATFNHDIKLADDGKAIFGAGSDLSLWHDATDSWIDSLTGDLYVRSQGDDLHLRATDDIYISPNGNDNGVTVTGGGAVIIYHNSSEKLRTNSNGLQLTGSLYFGDSETALFGAGNDMQIYHDGSNSYIKNATGALKIATETSGIAVTIGHTTSEVTVADNLTVTGNLTVSGTTTTVNSTTLDVADLNITVGKSATTSSATDGAGLTFGAWSSGTIPTLTWDHSNTRLSVNKPFHVTGAVTSESLTVDDVTINGSTISDAADLSIDVGADLTLDAGGGDIILSDDGTIVGTLSLNNNSGDFYIRSRVSDKDMLFRGNDGGSEITALTLDMSDAGTATFNHDIKLGDNSKVHLGADTDFSVYHTGSHGYVENNTGDLVLLNNANDKDIVFQSDDGAGGTTTYFKLDGSEAAHDGSSTTATYTRFPDLAYLSFGDSKDYNIRHHSNGHTYISGSSVRHGSNAFRVMNLADSETLIEALADGAVTLYYDNSAKIATASGGVTVTGEVAATSLDISGDVDIDGTLETDNLTVGGSQGSDGQVLTSTGSGVAWETPAGGTALDDITAGDAASTLATTAGDITIDAQGSDTDIIFKGTDGSTDTTFLTLDGSDAGSATFNSTVTATKLVSTNGILELDDNGSHNGIINVPASITINIDSDDGNTTESFSIAKDKTAINDTDVLFRVQEDGKVGIGTTSPSGKLDIHTVDTSAYSSTGEPVETAVIHNESGSDGTGATYYSSLGMTVGAGATSQGFINYVRTADNQGRFAFSQRTGSSSYAEAMTILNDGKVGIGTTSPDQTLTVSSASGTSAKFLGESGPHGLNVGGNDGGFGYIGHVSSGSYDIKVDSSGRVMMPQQPAFDAGRNAGYQADDNDFVQDSVRTNIGSHYDNSNGRFTAPVAGQYLVMFRIFTHDSGSVVQAEVTLKKNGGDHMIFRAHKVGGYHTPVQGTKIMTLAANDYINTYVGDSGTSSGWMGSAAEYNYFCAFLIG